MTMPTLNPDVSTTVAIKRLLRSRLGTQWRVGDRLPPVKELAKLLGTGQNNTNLAVQALSQEGLLASHRRRGTFVTSVPTQALALQGKTIVIYSSTRPFHQRMVTAFTSIVEPIGATVRQFMRGGDRDRPADNEADAMVYINPSAANPLRAQPHQLLSIISTTQSVSVANHPRYDLVSIDEHEGGALAGRMLRESGCRRPCFIGRWLDSDHSRFDAISSTRLHGFEAGWGEPLGAELLFKAHAYNQMGGSDAFRSFFELGERPDSVFTASDSLAYGVYIAAGSHGLIPGKDFQLVGFDGQGQSDELGIADLSTINVPCEQMGRRAAQLLVERFTDPDRPVEHAICRCQTHPGQTTRHD